MGAIRTVNVIGSGIGGLYAALTLADRGYDVTVLERDDAPVPPTVEAAWESWDRRGAPQARQSHVVLGRFARTLRKNHPKIYAQLLGSGATESTFAESLLPDAVDYRPETGDDDLTIVRSRRLVVKWVLYWAVHSDSRIAVHRGQNVVGLLASAGSIPHVTGVRTADGMTREADLTVVAGGKQPKLPNWFDATGTDQMPEETGESGVIYISRFYRLPSGRCIDRAAQ